MGYRIRAGFRRIARAIVVLTERFVHRPLSETTMKKLAMSATRRETFMWNVSRGIDKIAMPADPLFVRVEKDVIEEAVAETYSAVPVTEEISYPSASPTSSGAMMYEFSSSRFDLDQLDMEDETSVTETSVEPAEYIETEEEKAFFEDLYDDLTVDAVMEYMDTIELYAPQVYALEQPAMAGYIEAPVSQIAGLLSAPYIHIETEEERAFFESLYEDLAVDAIMGYMDTVEIHPKKENDFFESLYEDFGEETVTEYMAKLDEENEKAFLEDLYEDLAVDAVLDCMDRLEEESYFEGLYDDLTVDAVLECMDRLEEETFFEGLYEDLTVDAVLEYMDTIETEARPAPDYVISDISVPEVCETVVKIEAPVETVEEPVHKVAVQSILTQFVFGFDTPSVAKASGTKFRFIAGEEDEPETDVEGVQIMTYSGDAAVSAHSFTSGSLAL